MPRVSDKKAREVDRVGNQLGRKHHQEFEDELSIVAARLGLQEESIRDIFEEAYVSGNTSL